ncbi:ATP-dependent DNA helicase Snf21, partial [Coemansia sp. S610]
ERAAKELQQWRDAGHTGNAPERLMTESELPEEYLRDYNPVEERRQAEEEATRDKSRKTKRVYYDDGLSEEHWLDALEDDSVDRDSSIAKKRLERQERELGDNKLRRKCSKRKLGKGNGSSGVENCSSNDGDDDDDYSIEGVGESAAPPTGKKRGRPCRRANTESDIAHSGVGSSKRPRTALSAISKHNTPIVLVARTKKRRHEAAADADDEASATPEVAAP